MHFRVIGSEPLSGETVCSANGKRTPFPRLVTCEACLDWIAKNHRAVATEIRKRKESAA